MIKKIPKFFMMIIFAMLVLQMITAAAEAADEKNWPPVIRVGLIPHTGREGVLVRFQPLLAYMEKFLATPVKGYSADDYAGIITAIRLQQIECAFLGPKSYVEATEVAEVEPVAAEVNKNREVGYYGLIIAKKEIKTIEAAKDRIFAFTDANSTSGYLVPSVMFARDLNIAPLTYFKEIIFSGSHAASIEGIKSGELEVAATNSEDLDIMINNGKISQGDFTILRKSEIIPGSPFCVRKDLPESFKAALKKAILSFNDNKEALEKMQFGGYAPIADKDYNIIRELNLLKKKLSKKG